MKEKQLYYQNNKRWIRLLFFLIDRTLEFKKRENKNINSKSLTEWWKMINQELQDYKEPYESMQAIFEFQIIDKTEETRQLEFHDGLFFIYNNPEQDADCTLKLKGEHFEQFLLGDLNSRMAFMSGKIKIEGNIGLALKLEAMLKKYGFTK